jgi:hypothetical protein
MIAEKVNPLIKNLREEALRELTAEHSSVLDEYNDG